MAKKIQGTPRSVIASGSWMRRRPANGYSYLEVLREIERRKRGDYLLAPDARGEVFAAGVQRLAAQYVISSVLAELMAIYELTPATFLSLFGCETRDSADTLLECVLNPYQKQGKDDISNHADVDTLYPAMDLGRK